MPTDPSRNQSRVKSGLEPIFRSRPALSQIHFSGNRWDTVLYRIFSTVLRISSSQGITVPGLSIFGYVNGPWRTSEFWVACRGIII